MAINRPAQRFVKNIAEPSTRMQWPKALCVAGAMGTLLMSPMVLAQEPSPTKPIPATQTLASAAIVFETLSITNIVNHALFKLELKQPLLMRSMAANICSQPTVRGPTPKRRDYPINCRSLPSTIIRVTSADCAICHGIWGKLRKRWPPGRAKAGRSHVNP